VQEGLRRAIDDLTVAIEEGTEPYIAYSRRAEAHAKLARSRKGLRADSRRLDRLEAEPVLADLARAIEIRPDLAEAYLERAKIYREIGLAHQAEKDLETAAQCRQRR
jgi:Tfp pilus assembly protein PilF